MVWRVGDPLFSQTGHPGLVDRYDKDKEEITVDRDLSAVDRLHGYGYLKGMSEGVRDGFDEVMDEVRSVDSIDGKVLTLKDKIQVYEEDPSENQRILARYLKAELAHIMASHHYTPRYYQVESEKAK